MALEMIEAIFHPPILASCTLLLLFTAAILLLPRHHTQWIFTLVEQALGLDLDLILTSLSRTDSSSSAHGRMSTTAFLYAKQQLLAPFLRILLGWDPITGSEDATLHSMTTSPRGAITTRKQALERNTQYSGRGGLSLMDGLSESFMQRSRPSEDALHDSNDEPKVSVLTHPYVHGLVNTGNSCFLNSVLQALSALSSLPLYLESLLARSQDMRLSDEDVQVSEALLDTIEALQQPIASRDYFQPRAIVSALELSRARDPTSSGYHTNIMDRRQQDAQELFQMISSALTSEEASIQKLGATKPLLNLDFMKRLVSSLRPTTSNTTSSTVSRGQNNDGRISTSRGSTEMPKNLPTNPMVGLLASRLSCLKCGYTEAVRHFTFDNLSLPLPSAAICTIEDTLRQYIDLETLHDAACRKCSLIATLERVSDEIKRLDTPHWVHSTPTTTTNQNRTGAGMTTALSSSRDPDSSMLLIRRRNRNQLSSHVGQGRFSEDNHYSTSDEEGFGEDNEDYIEDNEEEEDDEDDDYEDVEDVEEDEDDNGSSMTRVTTASLKRPLSTQDRAARIVQLEQHRTALERAIQYDVQGQIPELTLTKVFSRHSTKQVMIAKPPTVLCLHFIRSQYSMYGTVSKNECRVAFPEILDLAEFCTNGVLSTIPNRPMSIWGEEPVRVEKKETFVDSRPSPVQLSKRQQKAQQRRLQQQPSPIQQSQPKEEEGQEAGTRPRPQRVLYRLQSIVVHHGSHSSGHFVAYRRKPKELVSKIQIGGGLGGLVYGGDRWTEQEAGFLLSDPTGWYRVSDETVDPSTIDHVLRSNPYMCVYERIEIPTESNPPLPSKRVTCGSNLSLQAVEIGFRKLIERTRKKTESVASSSLDDDDEEENEMSLARTASTSGGVVDLTTITEQEYADLFKEQRPRAIFSPAGGSSRMDLESTTDPAQHHPHQHSEALDENMSDMEGPVTRDGLRDSWRSFVSSPNSTMPSSPNTGLSDSSASSSSFASPLLRHRSEIDRVDGSEMGPSSRQYDPEGQPGQNGSVNEARQQNKGKGKSKGKGKGKGKKRKDAATTLEKSLYPTVAKSEASSSSSSSGLYSSGHGLRIQTTGSGSSSSPSSSSGFETRSQHHYKSPKASSSTSMSSPLATEPFASAAAAAMTSTAKICS